MQRYDACTERSICLWIEFSQPRGNYLHLRLRLADRYSGFEPGNHIEREGLALVQLFRLKSQWKPYFGIAGETDPFGNNTNHEVWFSVHHDVVPENFRITAIAPLPDSSAQNHDIRRAKGFVRRQEEASHLRCDAQCFKKSRRNICTRNAIRLVISQDEICTR